MNLSKLIVPMVTGLALSAAVASAQAQTAGDDATTAPSQNRGTAAGSNLNGTTNNSSSDSMGATDNSSTSNRVTTVSPAADEDAAADEMRVARADRN